MTGIIALLPQNMAKKGFRFVLVDETDHCKDCRLRKVCIENLEVERSYKVDEVRKKSFRCPVYGEMRVCKVSPVIEFFLTIPKNDAIDGVTMRYSGPRCYELTCPNFDMCNPIGLKAGDEIKIVKVSKLENPCKLGLDLAKCLIYLLI